MRWRGYGRDRDLLITSAGIQANHGLVLLGSRGVGKSTFASELADHLLDAGPVGPNEVFSDAFLLHASPGLQALPFGALAELLPSQDVTASGYTSDVVLRAYQHLQRRFHGMQGRTLIIVDDAHYLDVLSVELIRISAADERSTMSWVLIAETAVQLAPELTELWTRRGWTMCVLEPLSTDATRTLLADACGGRIDDASLRRIHAGTDGNPLLLHEFVAGAFAVEAIVLDDGAAQILPAAWSSTRLREALGQRIGTVSPDSRRLLEFLTVAGTADEATVVNAFGDLVVNDMERRGLLRLDRGSFELIHALFADVIGFQLSARQRRNLLADVVRTQLDWVAEAIQDEITVPGISGRLMELVSWDLESGHQLTPQAHLRVARLAAARNQLQLARRCIESLHAQDIALGSELVVADAELRAAEGDAHDAVQMLSEQLREGGDRTELLRAAQSMGAILQKFQAAPVVSVSILEDARFIIRDSELEPSLRILQAQTLVLNGLLAQADSLVETIQVTSLDHDRLGLEIVRLQSSANGGQWERAHRHADTTRQLTELTPETALTQLVAFCEGLADIFLHGVPALTEPPRPRRNRRERPTWPECSVLCWPETLSMRALSLNKRWRT